VNTDKKKNKKLNKGINKLSMGFMQVIFFLIIEIIYIFISLKDLLKNKK